MFTDMVGYTALGQRNEALSLALVEEQRKLIRPLLDRHNGREVKTIGDAFLVEFSSALDAVRCAYDIQRAAREFNISLPEDRRVHLRIGVHLGDIVESEGDIWGDAVNVASRVEPLAEDGGVCITRQVYDHVHNKFELPLVSLGPKAMKNVKSEVEVYKMTMPWNSEAVLAEKLDAKRIAVLPFDNISPNREDEYLAEGMTDELISTISRIRELRVIARTSAMKYKGSGKRITEIGNELRVGSVLEGTVRKGDGIIRVTAQLIDSRTEEDLWSESYDRDLKDLFAIQSEISRKVAESLRIQLHVGEEKDIERGATRSTEAYTLYLKGRYYWNERTREAVDKAVGYFERAAESDSNYALAFAGLADCYVIYGDYIWMKPDEAFPRAREYALKAIEIDPRLAEPHVSLGAVYNSYEGLWSKAEEEFRKAIELRPSYATAHMWYGLLLGAMLRFEEFYKRTETAGEFDPMSKIVKVNLGFGLIYLGRTKDAITKLEALIQDEPEYSGAHLALGQALFLDSKTEEAIDELRKAVALSGGDTATKAELACLLGFGGRRDEANRLLQELLDPSQTGWISSTKVAQVLFALGRPDDAFGYLDRAIEEKSAFINHGSTLADLRALPWFNEARRDPRWGVFLGRLGIAGT